MKRFLLLLALVPVAVATAATEGDPWWQEGRQQLEALKRHRPLDGPARNVILFVGDGMSLSTVTASRIFQGQQQGKPGENHRLSFEKLPWTALVSTFNTDAQVPDSAGTATALLSGVRTRMGVIGVDERVVRGDCAAQAAGRVPSLMEKAERAGLFTGVVTTTRITHATPAAAYAHSADRDWEVDSAMPAEALQAGCADIARQLVDFAHGDGLDVVLGGGRRNFLPASGTSVHGTGRRADGLDLITQWLSARHGRVYLSGLSAFQQVEVRPDQQLLGLFSDSHMQYEADRQNQPSLAQMTALAIRQLQARSRSSGKGYVLLVEGGRIDHASHGGNAYRALADTVALADAVQVAMDMTDARDTLLVVTADHGHTLTIAGYPARGNPILGLVRYPGHSEPALAEDGQPYTTLGYANGPGFASERADLHPGTSLERDFRQPALVPLRSETHDGTDVPLYARGPGAWLFHGSLNQQTVHHILLHALQLH